MPQLRLSQMLYREGVSPSLAELESLNLTLDARLRQAKMIKKAGYLPSRHWARFTVGFKLQNRDREHADFGTAVLVGVAVYDDRAAFPAGRKTSRRYEIGLGQLTRTSTHAGRWTPLRGDLLPHAKKALKLAHQRGRITSADLSKYYVTAFDLGWQVAGLASVRMQLRKLQLSAVVSPCQRMVDSAAGLRQAIAEYRSGLRQGCTITVTKDLSVDCAAGHSSGIVLDNVSPAASHPDARLTIQGDSAAPYRTIAAEDCLVAHAGVFTIRGSKGIVLRKLQVVSPGRPDRRAIVAVKATNLEISDLWIAARPSTAGTRAVGMYVLDSQEVVVDRVLVGARKQLRGMGIVLRNVRGFRVSRSVVRDMLSAAPAGTDSGILVDSGGGAGAQPAGNGTIYGCRVENVPAHGIYVGGADHIAVRKNTLVKVATGIGCNQLVSNCAGRGIYIDASARPGGGQDTWIEGNYLRDVWQLGAGGGINAGNVGVKRLIIEDNAVHWAGNSAHAQLPSRGEQIEGWGGYGISVREHALVQGNTIHNSGTYGILIQPGGSKVSVRGNDIRYSSVNNIKAVSGYSWDGRCGNHNMPTGQLSLIEIADNYIAGSPHSGINVEPRAKFLPCDYWFGYAVSLRGNTLVGNDQGDVGILLQNPFGYAPQTFQAHVVAPFGAQGQKTYVKRSPHVELGVPIKNDFTALRAAFEANAYMNWAP